MSVEKQTQQTVIVNHVKARKLGIVNKYQYKDFYKKYKKFKGSSRMTNEVEHYIDDVEYIVYSNDDSQHNHKMGCYNTKKQVSNNTPRINKLSFRQSPLKTNVLLI